MNQLAEICQAFLDSVIHHMDKRDAETKFLRKIWLHIQFTSGSNNSLTEKLKQKEKQKGLVVSS